MNSELDELAIVILNYKNFNMTIECVKKLISLNIECKIVIVDNNSPNCSVDRLKKEFYEYKNVVIIGNDINGGYGKGNNIGLKYIDSFEEYKYVCIMNPDVFIESKETFENLLIKLKKYNLQGITALQITNNVYDYSTLGWKIPNFKDIIVLNSNIISKIIYPIKYKTMDMINAQDAIAQIDVMPGCFFIMNKNSFKEIGFFDEGTFLYYEENILSKKSQKLGFKFGVSLNSYYLHNHKEKDETLLSFRNKFQDRRILLNSQRYYVKSILSVGFTKSIVYEISRLFNLYIELPIIHICKKVKSFFR